MALPRWIIGTVAVALALGAAACGDDDDGATPEEPSTAIADNPAESGASAPESPATVVDVAASNDDFSTLVTAVEAAGLAETLNGDGPFTVFAPVNDAFAALPAGTQLSRSDPADKFGPDPFRGYVALGAELDGDAINCSILGPVPASGPSKRRCRCRCFTATRTRPSPMALAMEATCAAHS